MPRDSRPPEPDQASPSEGTKRPRGRPKGDRPPLTPAEKQRAYRERQWQAMNAAYASPEGKPTKAVLAALSRYLENLDDPAKEADRELDRNSAARAIRELTKRYGLKHLR